jgi:hypothetical protein
MAELDDSIKRIRKAVKHVRSSPARMANFKSCIQRENIQCTKKVCLDVETMWNSTYLMLSIAEKYQKAFELLGEEDSHLVVPGSLDWENARAFVKYLQIFYDATLNMSGSNYVTSSLYFMQLCIIQDVLNAGCFESDPILSAMATSMQAKYDKYWGSLDKINLMLYIAFIVDPRYKLKVLVFWLKQCHGPTWAEAIEENVKDLLNRLIEQYRKFSGIEKSTLNFDIGCLDDTPLNVVDGTKSVMEKFNHISSQHLVETNDLECKSDVDRYLMDGCESATQDFDLLIWWKNNAFRYPILAEVARDVLAMPIFTVASESAFSTGGHILDPFRSSLSPLTVEALVCTQNWIRNTPINIRKLEEFVESYDDVQE